MSVNKVSHEGILLFEQPFVRVPYENFRKNFRTSQKYIERELGTVQATARELSKWPDGEMDATESAKAVQAMIDRVEGLKHKLEEFRSGATVETQAVMRSRLQHIGAIETVTTRDQPSYAQWVETRLDRWLVDWALRRGYESTARKIAETKSIQALVDIDLFAEIRRIEDALRNHSCAEALAWCSENKTALRKMKSSLEFDLRFQEVIELSRGGKKEEAITYARKYLAPWRDTHMRQILQASALYLFPPTTQYGTYKRLYEASRWTYLTQAFRQAIYALNLLPTEPLLHLSLYAGLASLKLPTCYDPNCRNLDCPVCDSQGLGQLAAEVPWSHHVNSTIVCRLSGKIMDEDNPPMSFPNGNVYSREALEEMASKSNGIVTCPRTGEICQFSDLRKVFVS